MDYEQVKEYIFSGKMDKFWLLEACGRNKPNTGIKLIMDATKCDEETAKMAYEDFAQRHNTPKTNPFIKTEEQAMRDRVEARRESKKHIISCPKCGSTAVTTGQRGYNIVWGFIGGNKTMNRCGNCGHSWSPKKQ